MARGFKDSTGKFRPTDKVTLTRKARDADIISGTTKSVDTSKPTLPKGRATSDILKRFGKKSSDFAKNRAKEFREKQQKKKELEAKDLQMRRSLANPVIDSFKRARTLGIRDKKQLKKFILTENPNIEDNPENIKFVETVLNEFLKRERFTKQQSGKASEEDAKDLKKELAKANKIEEDRAKMQREKEQKIFDDNEEKQRLAEEKAKDKIEKVETKQLDIEKKRKQLEKEIKTDTGDDESVTSAIQHDTKELKRIERQNKKDQEKVIDIGDEVFAKRAQEFTTNFPTEIL